jgi:hypothetical protein
LPDDHPLRRNENVFGFSVGAASLQILQLLMMVVAPLGIANAGAQLYHFVPGMLDEPRFAGCDENCAYPALTARGERTSFVVNGAHGRAEQVRRDRALAKRSIPLALRIADFSRRAADYLSARIAGPR